MKFFSFKVKNSLKVRIVTLITLITLYMTKGLLAGLLAGFRDSDAVHPPKTKTFLLFFIFLLNYLNGLHFL